ncbi:MAG: Rossmann-like fold-containing protein [Parachlamydiaceae bacterium]
MHLSNTTTGTYTTPSTTFSFDLSTPQTQVSGIDDPVPVCLPVDAKIEQALLNRHIQPIYQSRQEEVCFEFIPTENKTWEKEAVLPFSGETCKRRLFVGEEDFSYTEAYITKHLKTHPSLPHVITAIGFEQLEGDTMKRVSSLIEKGVTVLFGIDGQDLYNSFTGSRFPRIHWNLPFGGKSQGEKKAFKQVIPNFFSSCSKLQIVGDRIHITLMQGSHPKYWKTKQQQNPIVLGSAKAGYRLIRKRVFNSQRYPGYVHQITNSAVKYSRTGEERKKAEEREFVFEKTEIIPELCIEKIQALQNSQEKKYEIKTDKKQNPTLEDYYFECSTDEDSSDGFITDEDSL